MAIIQVSKIQVRTGAEADLPQLSIGEFGFTTDTGRLFIGEQPSANTSPIPNNVEVLTINTPGLSRVGGSNGDVQFNDNGELSGNSNVRIVSSKLTTNNDISVSTITVGTGGKVQNNFSYLNVAVGRDALANNIPTAGSGIRNVAVGRNALTTNYNGAFNTAIGSDASYNNTTGTNNVAVGDQALLHNQTGVRNVAVGSEAMFGNNSILSGWTGSDNIAVGYRAVRNLSSGIANIGIGYRALTDNSTGNWNVGIGYDALASNKTGGWNTAIGQLSLAGLEINPTLGTGLENTAVGAASGATLKAGRKNIFIGEDSGLGIDFANNTTILGSISFPSSTVLNDTVILGSGSTERLRINENGAWSTDAGLDYGTSGYVLKSNGPNSAPTWQDGGGDYVLPTASASVLGGVKVGSGLAIDGSGVLSATGGGGGTPAGSNNQIQFNLGGSFAASSNLTYSNNVVTIGGTLGLSLNANTATVTSTTTNSDLTIRANGTGAVLVGVANTSNSGKIESETGVGLVLVGDTDLNLQATSGNVIAVLSSGTSSKITISGPSPIQYSTGLANNDLTNKYYVDSAIANTFGGILSISRGGTGANNATEAINNLLPSQSGNNGKILTTNGTNVSWQTPGGGGYVLPTASATELGGIKVGSGLSIDGSGVLSATGGGGGGGTVTSIIAGTGLDGGTITTSGTISLANTGVSTGTYGSTSQTPVITVNAQGQITSVSNASISIDSIVPSQSGNNGKILTTNGTTVSWQTPGGGGYVLPTASATELGGIKVGSGLAIDGSGVLSATGGGGYVLPTASATELGGVKVGSGLSIDGSGVLSATGGGGYVLPTASDSVLGGIKVGSNLSIDGSGVLSATAYSLPTASASVLGGVKVGSNLSIDGSGVLSATAYSLPTASASVLGGVKVGSNLSIDGSGVLSATAYSLPTASASVLGGVKVGSGLAIDGSGVLSTTGGGGSGTVTSVGISVPSFLSVSNSPVTTSGTIAISYSGTALPVANGGTGATTAATAINNLLPSQTGNTGSYLVTDGTNVSWSSASSSIDPTNTLSYTTWPGNIRHAWGVYNFGDIYSGHDSQIISLGSIFSEILNVQVQLQRTTASPGIGAAYPILTTILSSNQFEVYLQETSSGFGPYKIYWSATGKAAVPGQPTGVTITPGSWIDNGNGTSSLTMTGSATGNPTLVYNWSYIDLDAAVTGWSTGTNTATITMTNFISNGSAEITLLVSNSLGSASAVITVTNPNFESTPSGGGGGD